MARGKKRKSSNAKDDEKKNKGKSVRSNSQDSKPASGKKSKLSGNKARNSPRKLGKGKTRCAAEVVPSNLLVNPNIIRFEEDGDDVVVELDGADTQEYPSEPEENSDEEVSINNNATRVADRRLIHYSSEEEGEITGEGDDDEIVTTPVQELAHKKIKSGMIKGKVKNTKKAEVEVIEPLPSTSSMTNEELINQAVHKTFEKMQQLMQASGGLPVAVNIPNLPSVPDLGMEQVQVPQNEEKRVKGKDGEELKIAHAGGARPKTGRGNGNDLSVTSASEITIYNRAIQPECNSVITEQEVERQINIIRDKEGNAVPKRDSTSSEDAAVDTSDEFIEAMVNEMNPNQNSVVEPNGNLVNMISGRGATNRDQGQMIRNQN